MPDVILNQPHTHLGVPYPTGAHLTVDANTAKWLVETGIAKADGDSASTAQSSAADVTAKSKSNPKE